MNNRKTKLLTLLGVLTLIILVSGATYAYFAVGTTNNFGTSTINATADSVGTVTLNGNDALLNMDLSAVDMMQQTNSITYYASSDNKTTTPTEETIAVASVNPTTDTNYYHCEYTLSISHTGTTDMYNLFNQETNNEYDYDERSTGQIILTVNGVDYDWASQNGMPSTIDGEFYIKGAAEVELTAGLRLINLNDTNQTYLAGSDISITISVVANSFTCTAEKETIISYYTHDGGSSVNKISDYNDLEVYKRFDTNDGKYYVYPVNSASTCETANGGVACNDVVQPYFIKETVGYKPSEQTKEVLISLDGTSWDPYGFFTNSEYTEFLTNFLPGVSLTCDGSSVDAGGALVKCITHEAGYAYDIPKYEACLNINNSVICIKMAAWSIASSIKSQFETAGFTCKYYDSDNNVWTNTKPTNGKLTCADSDPSGTLSAGVQYCEIADYGDAGCGIIKEGQCAMWTSGGRGAGCSSSNN